MEVRTKARKEKRRRNILTREIRKIKTRVDGKLNESQDKGYKRGDEKYKQGKQENLSYKKKNKKHKNK